jgi:uncharacterized protein
LTGEHPNAAIVRRMYQAFAVRDMQTLRELFADDAVWHLPGRSRISGDYRGADSIVNDFMARIGPLSGNTLKVELLDIAVGDDHAVAIQHATAAHEGRTLDVTACQVMRIRGGKIIEVQGHYSDLYAMDAFWLVAVQ